MAKQAKDNIRNFCIVAHIDHGKSTLADRIMEMTGRLPNAIWKTNFSTLWIWSAKEVSP